MGTESQEVISCKWQGSSGQDTGVKGSNIMGRHEHNRDKSECKSEGKEKKTNPK